MLMHNFNYDLSVGIESPQKSQVVTNKHILNQLNDVEYSGNSIIHSLELFADAVHDMDETILVPSRLMDLKIENPSDCKSISSLMNLPDLYTLYKAVQNMRTQLQWGGKDEDEISGNMGPNERPTDNNSGGSISKVLKNTGCHSSNNNNSVSCTVTANASSVVNNATTTTSCSSQSSNNSTANHTRRPSTASMSSTNSSAASTVSESESEGSVENDSGIDGETEKKANNLESLETQFRKNVIGLKENLKQLTEAANYVTKRYQKDVLNAKTVFD